MNIINGILCRVNRPIRHIFSKYDSAVYFKRRHLSSDCDKAKCCQDEPEILMNMKGKVALITGGATGIGLAAANELLRNEVCHCFITGTDPLAGQKAQNFLSGNYGSGKCTYMHLNVISSEQFEKVFDLATKEYGAVDILFNNAGIMEDNKWELEVETNFKSMIRANLMGLDLMSQSKTRDNSKKIIINNSDICALDPLPFVPVYSATKSGVISLTKSFGSKYHYKDTEVRVVGLCCGGTDTKLIKECATKQLTLEWGYDTFNHLTRKRLQKPDVVGRALVHLIKYANSGTIWTVENATLYETVIPHKSSLNYKVLKL